MSLTQLEGTMHNICKVWDSNPETTTTQKKINQIFLTKKKGNFLVFINSLIPLVSRRPIL